MRGLWRPVPALDLGLGQPGLHGLLEPELLDRDEIPAGSWSPWGARPARLAATLF